MSTVSITIQSGELGAAQAPFSSSPHQSLRRNPGYPKDLPTVPRPARPVEPARQCFRSWNLRNKSDMPIATGDTMFQTPTSCTRPRHCPRSQPNMSWVMKANVRSVMGSDSTVYVYTICHPQQRGTAMMPRLFRNPVASEVLIIQASEHASHRRSPKYRARVTA